MITKLKNKMELKKVKKMVNKESVVVIKSNDVIVSLYDKNTKKSYEPKRSYSLC